MINTGIVINLTQVSHYIFKSFLPEWYNNVCMFPAIDNKERGAKLNFFSVVKQFRHSRVKMRAHGVLSKKEIKMDKASSRRNDRITRALSLERIILGNGENVKVKTFFLTYCCLRLIGYTSNWISRYLLLPAQKNTTFFPFSAKLITALSRLLPLPCISAHKMSKWTFPVNCFCLFISQHGKCENNKYLM